MAASASRAVRSPVRDHITIDDGQGCRGSFVAVREFSRHSIATESNRIVWIGIQSARWLSSRGQSRPKQSPIWIVAFGVRLVRERDSNEPRRLSNCQAEGDVTRPSLDFALHKGQRYQRLTICRFTESQRVLSRNTNRAFILLRQ